MTPVVLLLALLSTQGALTQHPGSSVTRHVFPLITASLRGRDYNVFETAGKEEESFLIPLLNVYNAQYLMHLATGTPTDIDRRAVYSNYKTAGSSTHLQFFTVVPDTGSDDFWLPSVECKSQPNWRCPPDPPSLPGLPTLYRHLYNVTKSISAKPRIDGRRIAYGDGTTVKTMKVFDDVSLPGWNSVDANDHLLTIKSVAIERAVDFTSPTTTLIADGVLGLSLPQSGNADTFLSTLLKAYPNLTPMLSFYLAHFEVRDLKFNLKDVFNNQKRNSALIIGQPRWDVFAKEGNPNWTRAPPLSTSKKFRWLADLHRIGLSGTDFELDLTREPQWSSGAATLIDSGNSLITLHPTIWDAVAEQLIHNVPDCTLKDEGTNQRYVSCPCNEPWMAKILNLLRGTSWMPSLRMQFLKAESTDELFDVCISSAELILKDSDHPESCRLGMQVGPKQMPVPVVAGALFMRSVFVTFDLQKQSIAFARSKNSVLPAGATCDVESVSAGAQCTNFAVRSSLVLGPILALAIAFTCVPWNCGTQISSTEEKIPLLSKSGATTPGGVTDCSSPMITPKVRRECDNDN